MYLTPQKELPTEEELRTMDNEAHEQLISDYYNGAYAKAGYKPTFSQKMKFKFGALYKFAIGIVVIALVYGAINLVLVGGQEMWHGGDKKKLESLKSDLDARLIVIKNYEDINKKGNMTENQYKLYNQALDLYNSDVKQYNELAKSVGTTWYIIPGFGKGH